MIRVLIVCAGNRVETAEDFKVRRPFIYEQMQSLRPMGVDFEVFMVRGKGAIGYLSNTLRYWRILRSFKPDLVHAHYGFSGLFACLQWKVPVVVTFHGSDVNERQNRPISFVASRLASKSIFVNKSMPELLHICSPTVIPCGVDSDMFYPIDRQEARKALGLISDARYALFASAFSKPIKNAELAFESVSLLDEPVEVIELADKTRAEVNLLLNAVDLLLLTSKSEGSPQIVKEAMLCNCPVVSVNVGDVLEVLNGVERCFVTKAQPTNISEAMKLITKSPARALGREKALKYSLSNVATLVSEVYKEILAR